MRIKPKVSPNPETLLNKRSEMISKCRHLNMVPISEF